VQATTGAFQHSNPSNKQDSWCCMHDDEHDAEWGGAGEMSDAGEVVMALYDQLAPVAAKANQPGLLDHIFGLHVKV